MNVNTPNSSERLSTSPKRFSIIERYRTLLNATVIALSLSGAAACGGGNDKPDAMTEPDSGTGGTGGTDAGTGGSDAGTGGTETDGGMDPCEGLEVPGMVSVTLDHGEAGEAIINNPNSLYDGAGIRIPGAVLADAVRARFVVTELATDNAPNGYNLVRDENGVDIVAVPEDKQMVMDAQGINCVPNALELDPMLAMESQIDKRPEVHSPKGIRGTIAFRDGAGFELPGAGHTSAIAANNTVARVSHLSEYVAVNEAPVVSASASAGADKRVTIDLSGTSDEGQTGSMIYEGLKLEVSGYTFSQVGNGPTWRSDNPLPVGSHDLDITVTGLNDFDGDKTDAVVSVEVVDGDPCENVDCSGNGTCVDGACVCDAGYDSADCSSCDEPAGFIESKADASVCVDDPCAPEACNENGICSVNNSDQAVCACDNAGLDPANDCGSCKDNGQFEQNYPACSPDVTPPSAPVITTNGGIGWNINMPNFNLEGTTDTDTHEVFYNVDGGSFSKVNGYVPFDTNWIKDLTIPNPFEEHDYCFKVEDEANNQSDTDCISVARFN